MRRCIIFLEAMFLAATATCVLKWITTGDGRWEPWMAACSIPAAAFAILERRTTTHGSEPRDELAEIRQAASREKLSAVIPRVISFARERELPELEHWAKLEQGGYGSTSGMRAEDVVPEYRTVHGVWQDEFGRRLYLRDHPELEFVNQYRLRESVREMESLVSSEHENLAVFDTHLARVLQDGLNIRVERFVIHRSAVEGALERTRAHLLNLLADVPAAPPRHKQVEGND